jgi:general stress protein YciG
MSSTPPKPKSKRGFASMDPERQREIARKGGASVPPEKRAFSTDRTLAAAAGRIGGENSIGAKRGPRS